MRYRCTRMSITSPSWSTARQIVLLTPDLHEYPVQVPYVAKPTLTTLELPCVLGSELPTPLPDGVVGSDDSPLRQEFLDVAEA